MFRVGELCFAGHVCAEVAFGPAACVQAFLTYLTFHSESYSFTKPGSRRIGITVLGSRYTRLKCGSSDRGRTNARAAEWHLYERLHVHWRSIGHWLHLEPQVFTLEYDLLCPVALKHSAGDLLS